MKKVFLVCSFLLTMTPCFAQSSLKIIVPIGHTQSITSLAISPDDKFILSGGADNMVHLWSADAGRLLKTYRGHSGSVSTIIFSNSGKYFLSLDNTRRGFVREVMSGAIIDSVFVDEAKQLSASREQDGFCWIGKEGELHTWRPGESKIVAPQFRFFKVALSPNGKYVIALGEPITKEFYGYWEGTEFMAPADVYLINLQPVSQNFYAKQKFRTVINLDLLLMDHGHWWVIMVMLSSPMHLPPRS
jgi:WD40 repeat protein